MARSLSERSKEDRSQEVTEKIPKEKSFSDQIDEVMEQLNANCDLSMDDLYGAATSASTTSLNASTGEGGGKKGKGRRGGESGLTKKSNSTSQLSVSGKFLLVKLIWKEIIHFHSITISTTRMFSMRKDMLKFCLFVCLFLYFI